MLRPLQFGLAGGVVFGLTTLFLTWLCSTFDFGLDGLKVLSGIYPGYSVSFFGAFVGLLYSFFHGFFSLYFAARLYNRLNKQWTT